MKIRQKKLDDVTEKYKKQKKYQIELEEKLKIVFERYSIIMDDQLAEREKFQSFVRELEIKNHAASKIQAYWRNYKLKQKIKLQSNKKKILKNITKKKM